MRSKLTLCHNPNGRAKAITVEEALKLYPRQFSKLLATMGTEAAKPQKKPKALKIDPIPMFAEEEIPEVVLPRREP